jgi:hypothetical protein
LIEVFHGKKAAKKRQSETESAAPSSNENQMQIVVFQEQSGSGQSGSEQASPSGTNRVQCELVRGTQQHSIEPPNYGS